MVRAAMSRPSSLSIIPVPQTQFPGMAIAHRDFRLNFCINNGSKSMPNVVPVFRAALLDRQLDDVSTFCDCGLWRVLMLLADDSSLRGLGRGGGHSQAHGRATQGLAPRLRPPQK